MTKIYLQFLFLYFFSTCCFSQDTTLYVNSTTMKMKYDSAKLKFKNYEKKHGGYIQTKNVNLHYLEWGNPRNTPLIWIHGSFTNGYELMDLADSLSKGGYYVIAIDYYGHGLTKIPKHEVSLYDVADDIKSLMRFKRIEKAVIGGLSRGGIIATAFYDTYANNVLGLILEDGGSVSTNTHYHKLEQQVLNTQIKNIFKDRVAYSIFNSEYEAYRAFYDTNSGGTQFELLAWLTMNEKGKWSIGMGLEKLFNMSNEYEFLDNILRPTKSSLFGESMAIIEPKIVYRNLQVPMLILDPISDNDIFPYEIENEKLKMQHPNFITHKIYDKTGHNIHYEKPKIFLHDLLDFLKVIKKGRTI